MFIEKFISYFTQNIIKNCMSLNLVVGQKSAVDQDQRGRPNI